MDIEADTAFGDVDTEEGRSHTMLTVSNEDRQSRDRLVARMEDMSAPSAS